MTVQKSLRLDESGTAPDQRTSVHDDVAERRWVERIRSGDERAFEEMFLAYYRALGVYLESKVGSPAVAEELAQDIFLNVWQERATWQVGASVRAYLFGAARNRALNDLRDRKVVNRWEAVAVQQVEVSGMGQPPVSADRRTLQTELSAAFQRAMPTLPERQRQAFLLRWSAQLTNAEIADAMGISVKAVEFHLTRAFRALREQLAAYL